MAKNQHLQSHRKLELQAILQQDLLEFGNPSQPSLNEQAQDWITSLELGKWEAINWLPIFRLAGKSESLNEIQTFSSLNGMSPAAGRETQRLSTLDLKIVEKAVNQQSRVLRWMKVTSVNQMECWLSTSQDSEERKSINWKISLPDFHSSLAYQLGHSWDYQSTW